MTRQEIIKKLKEVKESISFFDLGLTDYARERAYMCIVEAIVKIEENEEE